MPHNSPGRAMTPDEEKKLFEVGAQHPGWAVAYWLAMLSMNTAAGRSASYSAAIWSARTM